MISKLNTRVSPASCLAMLALFVALGGVSYAAVGQIGTAEIKNGAVTKKKLRKGAVATAKIGDDAVTGQKVAEATLGTVPNAANAVLLAGKQPGAFESKGFGGGGDASLVKLPTNTVKTVATQALPAGTYLILARGGINNNGEEVPQGEACALSAGSVTQQVQFGVLAKNTEPGDREEFSLFVVATLPADGDAVLSCDTTNNWEDGNVTDPTIAAVSLQP
jgi:hypothetical protein